MGRRLPGAPQELTAASSRGPGAPARTPGASSAPTREAGTVPEIWGAPRRRVWRPQGLAKDGAPARELLEHAPRAAGAGPGRLARAGNGSLGGATSAHPARLERKAEGPPAATGARSAVGRVPGRGICPLGTLGFSGRGSGRATETRGPGAVARFFGAQQVGDSTLEELKVLSQGLF